MNQNTNDNYKILFGQYVKDHREKKGYTQQQLAELLGVTPKSISYIERGENYPSPENLFELAKILDMSLDEFIFSHKKFDKIISIEEINRQINQLSAKNQAFLIAATEALISTMLWDQKKTLK